MTIAGSLLIALLAITVDALFSLGERVTRISPHMKRYTIIFVSIMTIIAMGIGGWAMYCRHVKTDVIHIATKPMTEQLILGNILKELIEKKTDFNRRGYRRCRWWYIKYSTSYAFWPI